MYNNELSQLWQRKICSAFSLELTTITKYEAWLAHGTRVRQCRPIAKFESRACETGRSVKQIYNAVRMLHKISVIKRCQIINELYARKHQRCMTFIGCMSRQRTILICAQSMSQTHPHVVILYIKWMDRKAMLLPPVCRQNKTLQSLRHRYEETTKQFGPARYQSVLKSQMFTIKLVPIIRDIPLDVWKELDLYIIQIK